MSAPTAPGPAYSESSPSTGLPMSNGEPGPWVTWQDSGSGSF